MNESEEIHDTHAALRKKGGQEKEIGLSDSIIKQSVQDHPALCERIHLYVHFAQTDEKSTG